MHCWCKTIESLSKTLESCTHALLVQNKRDLGKLGAACTLCNFDNRAPTKYDQNAPSNYPGCEDGKNHDDHHTIVNDDDHKFEVMIMM